MQCIHVCIQKPKHTNEAQRVYYNHGRSDTMIVEFLFMPELFFDSWGVDDDQTSIQTYHQLEHLMQAIPCDDTHKKRLYVTC